MTRIAHESVSVIANTLEKSILPYITANTPTQHGYKTQHSTVTAIHTLNNTVSKGFKPNGSPCARNHCSTRYEQSFDTINIHPLIIKLLQTNIPGTIIQQGTQSLHNIYKSHILTPSIRNWRSTRLRPFTKTIEHLHYRHTTTQSTSSGHGLRLHTQVPVQPRNTYIKFYPDNTKLYLDNQNNLTLNPNQTTCTLFTPDPEEYKINLDLKLTTLHYPWQGTQRYWTLPETQNSYTAHTFTTSQYKHTSHHK